VACAWITLCDRNIIYFCMHLATGIHDINKREWFCGIYSQIWCEWLLIPSPVPQEKRISFLNWAIEKANFAAACDNMALRLLFYAVIYFRWKYLALWIWKVLCFGGLKEQPICLHVKVKTLVPSLVFYIQTDF